MNKDKQKIPELEMSLNFLGKITALFIKRYRMAYLLVMLIVVSGITSYFTLPREQLPEIVLPFAIVTTSYSGASPEDVESLVTDKIETRISGMDDVEAMESTSNLGYSQIIITFDSGSDMDLKGILVENELANVILPEGADDPRVFVFATSEIPLMNISISGNYDIYALTNIAEDLQDAIEKVEGVGNVEISGGLEREFHIYVDPAKLINYNLSINSIHSAITNANINQPIGDDDLDGLYINVRMDASMSSLEELKKLLIRTGNGDYLFLQDIADVQDAHEKVNQITEMYINREGLPKSSFPSVYLTVEREGGTDVVGSSQRVKQLLDEEKGSLYPEDISLYIANDQAEVVAEDLSDVTENAVSGLIVVIIVLFLFIGFREALLVAFVIPLSLMTTLGLMSSSNISLNGLSILGLIVSLGLLVDNAIVVMENVDRLRYAGVQRLEAAVYGTNQVAFAIMAATLTTLAAFYPLAILPDTMGDFIRVIPLAIMFAIASSFVMSIVVTPTLCAKYLRMSKQGTKHHTWLRILAILLVMAMSYYAFSVEGQFGLLSLIAAILFGIAMAVKQFKFADKNLEEANVIQWYEKNMAKVIESKWRKRLLLSLGFVALAGSISMIPIGVLKLTFMPQDEPDKVSVRITAPAGTTLESSKELAQIAESRIIDMGDIDNINTVIGGNDPNVSRMDVEFLDSLERSQSGFDLLEEIRRRLNDVPGAEVVVEGVAGGGPPGSGKPLVIELSGDNMEALSQAAEQIKNTLIEIPGVVSPEISVTKGARQIMIEVNKNKALMMGLNPVAIASEVRSYMTGIRATTLNIDQDDIDVVIKLTDDEITTTQELKNLYLTSSDGSKVPVISVAELVETKGISKIDHEDLKRIIKVEADLERGYNLNDVLKVYEQEITKQLLPESVETSYGGERQQMTESFLDLFKSMILAVILVYGILTIQFNSITQPFIIIMTVPMALVGVIWGLILTGNYFGFYAFMGLVALVGIAVNDAIVLVDYTNYLRSIGTDFTKAITKAGKTRFIPVFATSITTIGGILPLALKNAYYAQLGFALIFGLMVATVLTLVYIPIFYSFIEGRRIRKARKKRLKALGQELKNINNGQAMDK